MRGPYKRGVEGCTRTRDDMWYVVPKCSLGRFLLANSHVVVREVLPLALAHLLHEILVTIPQGQSTSRENDVIGTVGSGGGDRVQLITAVVRTVVLTSRSQKELGREIKTVYSG